MPDRLAQIAAKAVGAAERPQDKSLALGSLGATVQPTGVAEVGQGSFGIALGAQAEAETGLALGQTFRVVQSLGQADRPGIGPFGQTEAPQHTQTVADADAGIALSVGISLIGIGGPGLAVEVESGGKATGLAGAFRTLTGSLTTRVAGWMCSRRWVAVM